MKSLISRESYRPAQRYSGVYHIQGGMVTDADFDERSRITQQRTDDLGDNTIKDGVPRPGGAVAVAPDETLSLQEGVIYADGVRGDLRAIPGTNLANPLTLFEAQADLPEGPDLPTQAGDHVIYADIWDRPVHPLEDPYLADAGLHGAVTAFRTRTMTQLKAAPAAAAPDIEAGTGDFPQIGSAKLAINPLNAQILADECDPCADVVDAEQIVSNALWRLEIIDVEGTPQAPGVITLAWSIENAAAIAPSDVDHNAFERNNKVYEFYSGITESYLGVFADPADAHRSAFVDDLAVAPVPANGPDGNPWPFVRRWDGQAVVDTAAENIDGTLGGGFQIEMNGRVIKLTVEAFEAELHLDGNAVVAGDYWLVELRRHAKVAERIRLVSKTPYGVLHHYCVLFFTDDNGDIIPATDAAIRKLSFPALSNIPADHVGFDNNCQKLYADAENVQEALDNLCDISADDVAFVPNCPELYGNSDTVQEALDALCNIDFSVHASFRLLFDWGVLCGIAPKLVKLFSSIVSISAGAFMDQSGRITKFKGGEFDLSNLKLGETILFETFDAFDVALRKGEACLALAAGDGGDVTVFIVPKAIAFGPPDPGFEELVQACVDGKKTIGLEDAMIKLPEDGQKVVKKLLLSTTGGGAFSGSARLTEAEALHAKTFNDLLFTEFENLAEPDEVERLKERIQIAIDENPLDNLVGSALEVRRMQQATAVFGAFTLTDDERLRACTCAALFPTCPPDLGKPPFFVPIACLKGVTDNQIIFLEDVCPFYCRKQAMTWRAAQYFLVKRREEIAHQFAQECCLKEPDDEPFDPGLVYDPGKYKDLTISEVLREYEVINKLTGDDPKSPTDYVAKINVDGLSEAEAKKTLNGNGVDTTETIDIDDDGAFEFIEKSSVGIDAIDQLVSGGSVRPGDKVGLLIQDGTARGYILLERGSGKLPFPTNEGVTAIFRDFKESAEILIDDTNNAKEELDGLFKRRESLSSDVEGLKTEIDTLDTEREKAANAVTEVESQLGKLSEMRDEISREIDAAKEELEAAKTHREELVNTVRKSQPVTAIAGNRNPDLIAKLAGAGITSVADLADLSENQIEELKEGGIITITAAKKLHRDAVNFLKKPIG